MAKQGGDARMPVVVACFEWLPQLVGQVTVGCAQSAFAHHGLIGQARVAQTRTRSQSTKIRQIAVPGRIVQIQRDTDAVFSKVAMRACPLLLLALNGYPNS